MRLVLATPEFSFDGRSYAGFPLLLANDMAALEPAHSFLFETLIGSRGIQSKLTWEAYGRRLYDYFAFLEANGLEWDAEPVGKGLTPFAKYRDWSLGEIALDRSTVNHRLTLVARFYQWCATKGLIKNLPFELRPTAGKRNAMLAHTQRATGHLSPAVTVRQSVKPFKFLTKDQVRACFALELDPSHELMFHLMVRTGLRSCEARTFPASYVFNPRTRRGMSAGQMIRVDLDPADMEIKFSKPRSIDVPWSLMESMWSYLVHQREVRRQVDGGNPAPLLLSQRGTPFSKGAVVDVMESIGKKAGFDVGAHRLRHTYGTYTLSALRKSKDFAGEPLLYVRDRMGHSSAETTMVYLHLITQLDGQAVLAHEDEVDQLFASKPENLNG